MTVNPLSTAPVPLTAQAPPADAGKWHQRFLVRLLLVLGIILLLFAGTYMFAWNRANSLSAVYLADADKSYGTGKYLQALTGYEDFDAQTNKYVTHGGYMQVAKIWSDPHAWPIPSDVQRANARIDEILNQRLTIADAEGFVQANTGKQNPYLGVVYLRLGELYEKDGDKSSAREVYNDIPDLFPNDPALIERAKQDLLHLGQ